MKLMKRQRAVKTAKLALWMGGTIPFAIGIAHMFMPTWGFSTEVLAEFSEPVRAHFVDLALYAIASFLLAFGILSFYFAIAPITQQTLFLA